MVSRRRGSDDLDSAQQQSCSSSASSFDHLASTTMSLDLNDPHIIMAYDAVLHNDPLRWFLLSYGNRPAELRLIASGIGDIDELRSHIRAEDICFGLFREPSGDQSRRLALNYIPNSIKGVHRARVLVHGKAVANRFTANEQLTVSDPEQISIQSMRAALRMPPRMSQITPASPDGTQPVTQNPSPPRTVYRKPIPDMYPPASELPKEPTLPPTRMDTSPAPLNLAIDTQVPSYDSSSRIGKSATTTKTSDGFTSSRPSAIQPSSLPSEDANPLSPDVLAYISANMMPSPESPPSIPQTVTPSWLAKQAAPLPLPPDESEDSEDSQSSQKSDDSWNKPPSPDILSIPDSESDHSSPSHSPDMPPVPLKDEAPVPPKHEAVDGLPIPQTQSPIEQPAEVESSKVDGLPKSLRSLPKYISSRQPAGVSTASERLPSGSSFSASPTFRTRSRFSSRALSPEEEEEERKLAVLEEERKRRQAEIARREREEREEEEAREREFEERKERDRIRRIEAARKAEEKRLEMKRQQEEEEARKQAEKQRKEEETLRRRKEVGEQFMKQTGMDLMSGFITMEIGTHWKRRYYRLSTEQWFFYKDDEDTISPLHVIDLSGVVALREWNEGYEELEAIPNSFAVEVRDDSPCSFFADSSEDKEILLGLLNQAAGL